MGIWSWLNLELSSSPKKLRDPVQRHLGVSLAKAHSLSHEIKPVEGPNVQRVLDDWAADPKNKAWVCGYSSKGYLGETKFVRSLITNELVRAPLERARVECGSDQTLDCVVRGLYLFRRNGNAIVVAVQQAADFMKRLPVVEVIAGTDEIARRTLTDILEEARRKSVYKGRVLSLEQATALSDDLTVRVQDVRPTTKDDIVLPEQLIEVIERNVLGMLKHRETLRAANRSLRRGLLFHGPPGTGKTLMVRYLVHACKDHTVILMAGSQRAPFREACAIARLLAPSIVVLEDADLVAEVRDKNWRPMQLHDLLNEMDGVGPRDEVCFLLTTNRPDSLEPALAARPGRIDQAIAFPLPDDGCRRRLFEVYGRGLSLAAVDTERWVTQTNGVSHAFIEELLRKASLMAAERGENSRPLALTDLDMQSAANELVCFGGEISQKLLGFRTKQWWRPQNNDSD